MGGRMYQLSAIEIRDRFLKGELSASAITRTFLDRILKLDKQVGAFLSVFEDKAMARAE